MKLSERLLNVASLVSSDGILADIGTDHGYIPIYLVQQGKIRGAIASDVNMGPLNRALENVKLYNLQEYISLRLSNGLEKYSLGEVSSIVMAGMGADLMMDIIKRGEDICHEVSEIILQPQSNAAQFRLFLTNEGYKITDEKIVLEDGKYYPMMRVYFKGIPSTIKHELSEDEYFGKLLLDRKDHILKDYLMKEIIINDNITNKLKANLNTKNSASKSRYEEVTKYRNFIDKALARFEE